MARSRPIVLILSSDPAFCRRLTEIWPEGPDTPEFVLLQEDLCHDLRRDAFDLAIADGASPARHSQLTQALAAAGKPAIVVGRDEPAETRQVHGSLVELARDGEQWAVTATLVGREILRRTLAESRTRESEQARAAAEADATLGRYMVEMRNNVNNALTSVLGNAELLLHEPGLPAPVQAQADTIRNMALRLNEVFQRFSSIEKELDVTARESEKNSVPSSRAAAGR